MKKQGKNPLLDFDLSEVSKQPLPDIARQIVQPKKSFKASKSSAKKGGNEYGCRDGYTRHTYIISKQMVQQIHNIAVNLRCTESRLLEELLAPQIDAVIAKHGKKVIYAPKEVSII